jgi:hypothetical protein
LIAFNASVKVVEYAGERIVPLEDFICGHLRFSLKGKRQSDQFWMLSPMRFTSSFSTSAVSLRSA